MPLFFLSFLSSFSQNERGYHSFNSLNSPFKKSCRRFNKVFAVKENKLCTFVIAIVDKQYLLYS